MKRLLGLLLIVGLMVVFSLNVYAQDATKIGLSLPTYAEEFQVTLQASAQAAADEAGAELIVPETDAAYDVEVELANVQELIAAEVDVLLIYPADAVASVPAVQAATDAGIPVVLLEYGLAQAEDSEMMLDVASLITADWEAVGADAADYICEAIDGEGTVLVMQSAGISAMSDMEEGSEDMMAMTYPSIDAITSMTTGLTGYFEESCAGASVIVEATETYTNEDSLANFETMLDENRPAAVLITDADVAVEAINMIRSARLRGVTTVALERSDDVLGAIEGGQLNIVIIPQPEQLGTQGVTTALSIAGGEDVEAMITVDTVRVDSDSAEEYRVCLTSCG